MSSNFITHIKQFMLSVYRFVPTMKFCRTITLQNNRCCSCFCLNENHFKIMKNAFYFNLKALPVFKIFNFLSSLFAMQKSDLIRKLKLISKVITSQTGKQIITIYYLPNTSKRKGINVMKFDRLIEYNMRNMFL